MCLFTTQKEPQIATEDMVVFKEVSSRIDPVNENDLSYKPDVVHAAFFSFTYRKDVLNQTKLDIRSYNPWRSESRPYDKIARFFFDDHQRSNPNLFEVRAGFHAALSNVRLDLMGKRFTIPKGSEYFTDGTGLIVSNQIIYTP